MSPRLLSALCAAAALAAIVPSMAQAEPGPWAMYNKSHDGQRFSTARSITPANVGTLKRVCEAHLGDAGSFHSGLVVIDRTLYVTTGHTTVAIDATNCSIRWRHVYKPQDLELYAVNRGVAYLDGRVYRGTGDGRVFALDAKTGKQLWSSPACAGYRRDRTPSLCSRRRAGMGSGSASQGRCRAHE